MAEPKVARKSIAVSIYLPAWLAELVRAQAEREGRSISNQVVRLIELGVEK